MVVKASPAVPLYLPGEEVLVRLSGAEAYNVERMAAIESACLPSWTIGTVIERRNVEGRRGYVVRMEHDGCACVCVVEEQAIEGTA
jgi:hypothetical protein